MAQTDTIETLKHARPGDRFQRIHRRRHESPHGKLKNAGFVVAGVLTVAAGVLTYPVPVVPSDLVILAGIALLAQGSRRGAKMLDAAEVWFRRRFAAPIALWRGLSGKAKIAVGLLWTSTFSAVGIVVYRVLAD